MRGRVCGITACITAVVLTSGCSSLFSGDTHVTLPPQEKLFVTSGYDFSTDDPEKFEAGMYEGGTAEAFSLLESHPVVLFFDCVDGRETDADGGPPPSAPAPGTDMKQVGANLIQKPDARGYTFVYVYQALNWRVRVVLDAEKVAESPSASASPSASPSAEPSELPIVELGEGADEAWQGAPGGDSEENKFDREIYVDPATEPSVLDALRNEAIKDLTALYGPQEMLTVFCAYNYRTKKYTEIVKALSLPNDEPRAFAQLLPEGNGYFFYFGGTGRFYDLDFNEVTTVKLEDLFTDITTGNSNMTLQGVRVIKDHFMTKTNYETYIDIYTVLEKTATVDENYEPGEDFYKEDAPSPQPADDLDPAYAKTRVTLRPIDKDNSAPNKDRILCPVGTNIVEYNYVDTSGRPFQLRWAITGGLNLQAGAAYDLKNPRNNHLSAGDAFAKATLHAVVKSVGSGVARDYSNFIREGIILRGDLYHTYLSDRSYRWNGSSNWYTSDFVKRAALYSRNIYSYAKGKDLEVEMWKDKFSWSDFKFITVSDTFNIATETAALYGELDMGRSYIMTAETTKAASPEYAAGGLSGGSVSYTPGKVSINLPSANITRDIALADIKPQFSPPPKAAPDPMPSRAPVIAPSASPSSGTTVTADTTPVTKAILSAGVTRRTAGYGMDCAAAVTHDALLLARSAGSDKAGVLDILPLTLLDKSSGESTTIVGNDSGGAVSNNTKYPEQQPNRLSAESVLAIGDSKYLIATVYGGVFQYNPAVAGRGGVALDIPVFRVWANADGSYTALGFTQTGENYTENDYPKAKVITFYLSGTSAAQAFEEARLAARDAAWRAEYEARFNEADDAAALDRILAALTLELGKAKAGAAPGAAQDALARKGEILTEVYNGAAAKLEEAAAEELERRRLEEQERLAAENELLKKLEGQTPEISEEAQRAADEAQAVQEWYDVGLTVDDAGYQEMVEKANGLLEEVNAALKDDPANAELLHQKAHYTNICNALAAGREERESLITMSEVQ